MRGGSASAVSLVFCYSERITFQLRTSCSPPPALLTTGLPSVKCASSIASAHPVAIAFSRSAWKSGRGGLTAPVEGIEEADMRRDERRRADDVVQPLAKFAQLRAVFDLDENGPERRNDGTRDGGLHHS
jgi:hypothetical protein